MIVEGKVFHKAVKQEIDEWYEEVSETEYARLK